MKRVVRTKYEIKNHKTETNPKHRQEQPLRESSIKFRSNAHFLSIIYIRQVCVSHGQIRENESPITESNIVFQPSPSTYSRSLFEPFLYFSGRIKIKACLLALASSDNVRVPDVASVAKHSKRDSDCFFSFECVLCSW